MSDNIYFISMEGKTNYKIGNFAVREDIPLPVYVQDGGKLSLEKINPENIIGGMLKILMEDSQNDHLDYYRDFIFSVQPDIEARLTSGAYEAEQSEHFKDALDIFRVLLALKPNSLDANLNLAICYDEYSQSLFDKGREQEALKMEELAFDFFKIVDEFEDKPENALYYLGRFYLYRENYEKSVNYFDEFVRNTTDQERKKEVIDVLKNIRDFGVTDSDYQDAVAMIHSDNESESFGYIERYIQKFPNSWHGYYLKGLAFRKMEKFNEAIENLDKALQLNIDSSDIYNELGLCYMNLGVFHKGELNFNKALRKNPEDLIILSNLAMLYFKKGDKEEALKYCDIVIEFDPNDLYTKNLRKMIDENL